MQTLQRPWGTTAITRWGLLGGLNHCVAWCLVRRSGGKFHGRKRAGFYESVFRCPTLSCQVFENFGSRSLQLDPDPPREGKRTEMRFSIGNRLNMPDFSREKETLASVSLECRCEV